MFQYFIPLVPGTFCSLETNRLPHHALPRRVACCASTAPPAFRPACPSLQGAMRRRMQRGVGGAPGGGSKSLPPSLNLLAAALAGTMNQLFTLPLENITTRMQTAQRTPPSSAGDGGGSIPTPRKLLATRREQAFGGDLPGGADDVGEKKLPQVAIGRDFGLSEIVQPVKNLRGGTGNDVKDDIVGGEEIDRDRPGSNTSAAYAAASCLPGREVQQQTGRQRRQSMLAVAAELYREGGGIARFWRGFVPSLVLTCNPAINYTAFDLLKALWLRRRAAVEAGAAATASAAAGVGASARGESSAPRVAAGSEGFLNPVEAFLVAAAAKSLATLITYPLIRAKVLLMTSSRSRPIPSSCLRPASRPSCRFPSAGAPSVAATGEETSPKRPPNASSPLAVRKEGAFKRDGDGDCQQGRDDSTTEDGGDGAFGTRQQERARYSVGGNATDGSLSTATGESCVRNGSDAAAAAAGAARGGSGDGDVRGMGTVMLDIFHREGIGGLYTGCGAQVCGNASARGGGVLIIRHGRSRITHA